MSDSPDSNPPSGEIKDFEKSLDELEKLVSRLEQGDLTLEDTLAEFERGMLLHGRCQKALDEAQLRVDMLLKSSDFKKSVPFDPETP